MVGSPQASWIWYAEENQKGVNIAEVGKLLTLPKRFVLEASYRVNHSRSSCVAIEAIVERDVGFDLIFLLGQGYHWQHPQEDTREPCSEP